MDKFTAAESIRRLAQMYAAMVEAADALEAIGKIEQATLEQKAQAEAAKVEADAAKAELADVKGKIKKALEDGQVKLDKMSDKAAEDVAGQKRSAEEFAAEIIKRGQDEAAKLVADAATQKAVMSSELGALQAAISAAKGELQKLDFDKQMAEKATADAEGKLAAARDNIRALAGL